MKRSVIFLVFLSINFCFAQWIPSQSGTNQTLHSVCFLDSTTGWIVGNSATVLKSVDGGKNWESHFLGISQNLYSIQFINKTHGWIVGDSGIVLETTNAGTDWQLQNSGTDKTLFSVFFIDTLTGWGVGDSGVIICTVDGGLSWTKRESGVNSQLRSTYFFDSQLGYAVGHYGTILSTFDGGINWSIESYSPNFNLNSILITEMVTTWTIGSDSDYPYSLIFRKLIDEPGWPLNYIQKGGMLNSVYFTNENTGYVAGESGVIIKTVNAGDSWRSQNSNTEKNLYSIFFTDSIRGWAVGDSGAIVKTNTGGIELTTQPSLVYPPNNSVSLPLSFELVWQACTDADYYQVRLATDPDFSSIFIDSITTDTTLQLSDLIIDTTYYWRVNAQNILGKSEWSETWHFKTLFPTPVLIAPENSAQFVSIYPILKWQEYNGVDFYELRITDDYGNFSEPLYVDSTLKTSSTQIYGLSYGHYYYWKVRIRKGSLMSAWSETWSFGCENAPSGWYHQYSNTSSPLNYVQFISENIGWIAGDHGTFLKTLDGGINWNKLPSFTNSYLESLHFINPDTGWVVGQEGVIFKTYNGGTTWNNYSISNKINIYAVSFPTEKTGWIAGSTWNGSFSEARIFKSTDGGMTWINQTPESLPALYSIYFIDDSTGWAVGGSGSQYLILKTIDSGTTWEKTQGSNYLLKSVFFTDPNNGWAVGEYGCILKTNDAGIYWKKCNNDLQVNLNSVHFINSVIGWAVGYAGVLLSTKDGGETWTVEVSGTEKHLYSVFFTNSGTGWAVGDHGEIIKTTTGGIASTPILKSPDYDAIGVSENPILSWSKVDGIDNYRVQIALDKNLTDLVYDDYCNADTIQISDLKKKTSYFWRVGAVISDQSYGWSEIWKFEIANKWKLLNCGTRETFYSTCFINNSTGWAAGSNRTIIKTNNGGKNWEICYQNIQQDMFNFNSIHFVNSSVGWVVGDYGKIMKTTNGGITWSYQSSGTTIRLESCCFSDINNGIAVGGGWDDATNSYKSVILRTSDGGKKWDADKRSSPGYLLDVFLVDSTTGWISGDGTILKTTDGGKTWDSQNPGVSGFLNSICFINQDIGWIANVASNPYTKILKTTDGGNSWISYEIATDMGMTSIFFTDSQNGWLAAQNCLMYTTNGGENWQIEYKDHLQVFNSLYFTNKNTGWVVGSEGLILKTVDSDPAAIDNPGYEPIKFYRLSQNYPNPFNPTTTIQYDIAKTSDVIIQIFNINGQVVETLVHRQQEPGSYSINWNAKNVSSGIYLYRLQAGDFQQVRKCLIVK